MKNKISSLVALLCILSLLLCACYSSVDSPIVASADMSNDSSDAEPQNDKFGDTPQIVVNHTCSSDNLTAAAYSIGSVFPVAGGYYKASNPITYFDIEHEARIVMCNLAGCSHNTDDCPAYMPGLRYLLATEEAVYAFCESSGSISLVKLNLHTYEKTTQWLMANNENQFYGIRTGRYSSGRIYFDYDEITTSESRTYTNVYNTETGETSLLFAGTELASFDVKGAYGNTVLTAWSEYDEAPMQIEEYLSQHPDMDEMECVEEYYDVYLTEFSKEHHTGGLRFYDSETMQYTDAYPALRGDSEETPYIYLSSDSCCFGEYLLYKLGDAVMRYSLKTGERELLVEEPGIINGHLLDGKLIYLTHVNILQVHVYDLQNGTDTIVDNAGNTETMTFGIYMETEDAFIGFDDYVNHDQGWILKEDFYNGRYENAHKS